MIKTYDLLKALEGKDYILLSIAKDHNITSGALIDFAPSIENSPKGVVIDSNININNYIVWVVAFNAKELNNFMLNSLHLIPLDSEWMYSLTNKQDKEIVYSTTFGRIFNIVTKSLKRGVDVII